MPTETFNFVTIVLSIGAVISPMFFGCIFLFMFKWFPTRREIELQEASQQARHQENQERFTSIETDIKQLLTR